MEEKLKELVTKVQAALQGGADPEDVRVKYLGKKGELTAILSGMGKLPPDQRRTVGEVANKVKGELEGLITQALQRREDAKLEQELKGPKLDVTLPGRGVLRPGRRHPVSQTLEDI